MAWSDYHNAHHHSETRNMFVELRVKVTYEYKSQVYT